MAILISLNYSDCTLRFLFMEQLSKLENPRMTKLFGKIYQRNNVLYWFKCGYRLHQCQQQVFVSRCCQRLEPFFLLQSFKRGNTPVSEQRIGGEKSLLKGNFNCYKLCLFIQMDTLTLTILVTRFLATVCFTIFLLPKVSSEWTRHQIKLVFLASTTQISSTRYLGNIFVQLSAWWFISYAVRRQFNLQFCPEETIGRGPLYP